MLVCCSLYRSTQTVVPLAQTAVCRVVSCITRRVQGPSKKTQQLHAVTAVLDLPVYVPEYLLVNAGHVPTAITEPMV